MNYLKFYEAYEAEQERLKNKKLLEEQKEQDKYQTAREFQETAAMAMKHKKEIGNYKKSIRDSLVTEAVLAIFNASLGQGGSLGYQNEDNIKRGLCMKFVQEHNSLDLLKRFKTASEMLSEYALIINRYVDLIHEDVKEKDTCEIDDKLKSDFYEELLDVDNSDVGFAVKNRVANAIAAYNDKNLEDKMDLENAAELAQQKIDSAKTKELKEHYEFQAKQAENKIRNRPKSVYESMVTSLVSSWYTDESVREEYTGEDGDVDIERVEESCELLYTFLETLNTAKIWDIDEEFIKGVLS